MSPMVPMEHQNMNDDRNTSFDEHAGGYDVIRAEKRERGTER